MIFPTTFDQRLAALHRLLESLQPGLIAVSGGVDSRLLAHVARIWGLDFQLAYATGPHQTEQERQAALDWLGAQGKPMHVVGFDPLVFPEVHNNDPQRCYYCKRALFTLLGELAAACALPHILDGTQADDLRGHRPGWSALVELGVRSPLVDAGMDKADIRQAAQMFHMGNPDQPARPCLLTRFPYSRAISRKRLAAVGQVEDRLAGLGLLRFRFRVLTKGNYCLQIHRAERQVWQMVATQALAIMSNVGLTPCDVMETEQLSGFFDKE